MRVESLNPFTWTDAVALSDAVSRQPFTDRAVQTLKAGTHAALFGPRGTGKTSFLLELEAELKNEQGLDAPEWSMIRIDLRRAISLPAFISSVADALAKHPDGQLRRRAKSALREVEKEFGVNLGIVKAGMKSGPRQELNEEVILHAQLAALPTLADRVVVAFDEFQRLASCPGDPLSQIRSALMGPSNAGHVSLVLTGSLREKLKLMLKTDTEPIWDQTLEMELPDLDQVRFIEYLQLRYEASGRPITDSAVELLVELGGNHPKRTQQLAWHAWDRPAVVDEIGVDDVNEAYEYLVASEDQVAQVVDAMLAGDTTDINDARALFLVGAGEPTGSRVAARRYGLTDESATQRALQRLKHRGLVVDSGGWRVVDPLLAEWLRRKSPVQLTGS